jgi:hypothetical protein
MKIKRIVLENGTECELRPPLNPASCEGCIFEEGLGDICNIENIDCDSVVIVKVESTKDRLIKAIDEEIEKDNYDDAVCGLQLAKEIVKEVLK